MNRIFHKGPRTGIGLFGAIISAVALVPFTSPAQGILEPRISSLGFSLDGDLEVIAEVPPGYRHAVLEVIPEGGNPTLWQPMVSGPMTGATGSLRFTLPMQGSHALLRLAIGASTVVPPATFSGLEFMNASYSDGGFFILESSKPVHVLNRLGYGPSAGDLGLVDAMGTEAYINEQLAPGTIDESANALLNDGIDALFHEYLPYGGNPFVSPGDSCRFFRGVSEPPVDWSTHGFDDSTWEVGITGLGYGDNDDATVLDDMRFEDGVHAGYLTVYCRQVFDVPDPSAIDDLILRMKYDDGFVAYINGNEVARINVSADPAYFDDPADASLGNVDNSSRQGEWIINAAKSYLVSGPNTLAVQLHNTSLTSSDASLIPTLVNDSVAPYPAIQGVKQLQHLLHLRGIYSRKQLQAVLGEFWENHFTTDYDKVRDYLEDVQAFQSLDMVDSSRVTQQTKIEAASLEYDEYQFLYDNALGNFGDLLLFSAASPTMLIYLDNVLNEQNAPNENYAREILELHSHGVDNGYTQFDIEEIARCFTGWTVRKVKASDQLPFPQSALTPPTTPSIMVDSVTAALDSGPTGASWHFYRGTAEPTPGSVGEATIDWTTENFDPTGWVSGFSGFGYGDGDDTTVLSDMQFQEGVQPGYGSVYIRTEFTITPGTFDDLVLEIDYDDGYVAYLNGTEIARSSTMNNRGTPPPFDAFSGSHEAGNPATIDLTPFTGLIKEAPDTNVLAIQGHNTSLNSSDFSLIPRILQRTYTADSIGEADANGVWTFRFDPDEHDTGEKIIFGGRTYELIIPAGRLGVDGVDDAIDVIDALVANPPTAEFICLKLVNRFVSDEISLDTYQGRTAPEWLLTIMDDAIAAWYSTAPNGNIATVMQSILDPANQTNGFWIDGARFSKIKTSIEYINSGFRALGATVTSTNLPDRNEDMGMDLFQRDEPDGYSEIGVDWMDTLGLLERMKFGQALGLNDGFSRSAWDIDATLAANSITTPDELIDYFDTLLFDGRLTLARRTVFLQFADTDEAGASSPFTSLSASAKTTRLRELTGLILSTPEFQYQ